jgi:hypothetical protein
MNSDAKIRIYKIIQLLPLLLSTAIKSLAGAIKQEKEINSTHTGKKENYPFLQTT